MTFVSNVILHLVEIKQEVVPKCVNPQSLFIDFCDSSDEDGTPSIFFCLSIFSLHTSHYASVFVYSQYSISNIPFLLSVIDYLEAMSFAVHVSSELRDLNYDNFCIENVHCILSRFSGDVLFELPHVVNPDVHFG